MRRARLSTSYVDHDRSRETERTPDKRREKVRDRASAVGGALRASEGFAARRRPNELDEEVGRRVSDFCGAGERRAFYGCGWARVCGFLPRRYGRNDRAFARGGCGGDCETRARRHYGD